MSARPREKGAPAPPASSAPPVTPAPFRALFSAPATWTALALAALVLWVHAPFLADGGLLGAPGTDVIRAAWGLDHQARALLSTSGPGLPFWTDRVGFPEGVKLLVLPMVSSVLGVPLHAVLGPIAGYDAWVLALLWASGFATALLVEKVSGSAAAGLLAGAALVVQPMLLLAITDGTPEYVAFWPVPALLLAVWAARREAGLGLPIAAGLLAVIVALDSPYHAVFALPFAPIVAWGTRRRNLVVTAVATAVGAIALVGAYVGLPVGAMEEQRLGTNAVQLSVWAQWENGTTNAPWDYTLAPGLVPLATIAAALGLAVLRPIRALPWVLVAALCFAFAMGTSAENPLWLERNVGSTAGAVGRAVAALNQAVDMPVVRFPRRWLVPGALALWVAAGIGLSRFPWPGLRVAIAIPLAGWVVAHTMTLTGYREALPSFPAPTAEFASFIGDHAGDGAVLALPSIRGAATIAVKREDIPIWAGLDPAIRSADQIWIQLATGRPTVYVPDGMRTMERRTRREAETEKLLRDLDDLTTPQTTGRPIPPSATQEPPRRAAAAARLVERGLRYVAVDEATYGTEGLALARAAFESRIVEERHFDDGTGVTVWVVE